MWGHDSDSKVLLINVFNIHFHTDRINEQIKQYFGSVSGRRNRDTQSVTMVFVVSFYNLI